VTVWPLAQAALWIGSRLSMMESRRLKSERG